MSIFSTQAIPSPRPSSTFSDGSWEEVDFQGTSTNRVEAVASFLGSSAQAATQVSPKPLTPARVQVPICDEFSLPPEVTPLAVAIDLNATLRNGAQVGASSSILAGVSAQAPALILLSQVISALQVVQGIWLIILAKNLLPDSSEALKEASKIKSQDLNTHKIAQLTHWNNAALLGLGVLFLVLGAVAIVAATGFYAGVLLPLATILGGILSLVSLVRGSMLIYRSAASLIEVKKIEEEIKDIISKGNGEQLLNMLAPELETGERNWVYCERLAGKKVRKELEKAIESGLYLTSNLASLLQDGFYEVRLKHKVFLAIGSLMVLGGAAGIAAAATAPPVLAVGSASALALATASSGLFVFMESLWLPVDSSWVFTKTKALFQKNDSQYVDLLNKNPLFLTQQVKNFLITEWANLDPFNLDAIEKDGENNYQQDIARWGDGVSWQRDGEDEKVIKNQSDLQDVLNRYCNEENLHLMNAVKKIMGQGIGNHIKYSCVDGLIIQKIEQGNSFPLLKGKFILAEKPQKEDYITGRDLNIGISPKKMKITESEEGLRVEANLILRLNNSGVTKSEGEMISFEFIINKETGFASDVSLSFS